jgi:hypothetical protein
VLPQAARQPAAESPGMVLIVELPYGWQQSWRRDVLAVEASGSASRKLALMGSVPLFSRTRVNATAGSAEAFSSCSLTAE